MISFNEGWKMLRKRRKRNLKENKTEKVKKEKTTIGRKITEKKAQESCRNCNKK